MFNTDKNLRNKVIYQVFTRNYKGGTFVSVMEDLDRIKALGVDYVYLLPINPSGVKNRKGSMGSPYAISDYRAIDPVQGTLDDFDALSKAIHDKGMKLIIDIVYNHTSPDSWLAQNHNEWFYHKEDGSCGNRIGDWWDVIDLDYDNEELWDYQIETLKMWAEYVDGYRCDVAPMVPLEFWKKAREEVATIKSDFLWIAEAVEPEFIKFNRLSGVPTSTDSELFTVFDICYDYDIYGNMKNAMTGNGKLSEYTAAMNRQEVIYPDNYCKLRCLENHDRPRVATLVPDEKALRNWTAFNYFAKGIVMIYNGQESCDTHHPTLFDLDPVCFDTGKDIADLLKTLADIKKNPIFAQGVYFVDVAGNTEDVIVAEYRSVAGSKGIPSRAVGIFTTSGKSQSVIVDLEDGKYTNLITGEEVDVFERTTFIDGEPVIIIV